MRRVVYIKLGGSLITDKTRRYTVRRDVLQRVSTEIAQARAAMPELRLIIGHGSGSFGHVAAQESGFDPRRGHGSPAAFAAVSAAAAALNATVRACLLEAGVPAVSLAPSASALVQDGRLVSFATAPYEALLQWGAVPLTFGDVAATPDGGTILSTESVFRALAEVLPPDEIILLGEVEGVYSEDPRGRNVPVPLLKRITPSTWEGIRAGLGGSHGTDVTGGMADKVSQAVALVETMDGLTVRIASGMRPGLVAQLLRGHALAAGTLIARDGHEESPRLADASHGLSR